MSIMHKLTTGAVAVVSVAALTAVAAPANATSQGAAKTTAAAETRSARAGCSSWWNAVGVPGKWSKAKGCSILGSSGLKVGYEWKAEKGSPCIKAKYFVKGGPKGYKTKWTKPLCGKSGTFKNLPWGNVAATKEIQIKGFAMLKWR